MVRLFLPELPAAPGTVQVRGEPFHHLARVLRATVGQEVEVFDRGGRAFQGRVTRLSGSEAELLLEAEVLSELPRPVVLVQGLPKGDRWEWTLQKATELSASGFHPVETERSVVRVPQQREPKRRARWQRIAEEAARQCHRRDVPPVEEVRPLLEAARTLAPSFHLLVLDEEERDRRLGAVALGRPRDEPLAIVVGPEGGLARAEVAALQALGATPVGLGPLTLRSETAGLAALCIIRHLEGLVG